MIRRDCWVLLLVGLCGCGGESMAGDWSGDLSCADGSVAAIEFDLDEPEEGLKYSGGYFFQAYNNETVDGDIYRLESDWEGTISVTQVEESGEQEVTFALTRNVPSCQVFKNDNKLSDECYYGGFGIGFDLPEEIVGDWDGLDEIALESLACEGEVER